MHIDKQAKVIYVSVPGCSFGRSDAAVEVKPEDLTDVQRRTYTYYVPACDEAQRIQRLALEFLKTPVGRKFVSTRLLKSLDDLYDFLYENPTYIHEHFTPIDTIIRGLPEDRIQFVEIPGDPEFKPSPSLLRLLNFKSKLPSQVAKFGVSTYYINMEKATERRRVLETEARKRKLALTRVDAITPKTLKHKIDFTYEQLPKNEQIGLSCLTSHLVALESFLVHSKHEFALILEDDICLDGMDKWPFSLEDLARNMPEDCGTLQLCALWPVRQQGDRLVLLAPTEHKLRQRVPNIDWNTAAYLIRREQAEQIVGYFKNEADKFCLSRYPGTKAADVVLYDDSVYRSINRTLSVPLLYCEGLDKQTSSFDRTETSQTLMHTASRNYAVGLLNREFSFETLGFFGQTPVNYFPRVSIITPTYNRSQFLPLLEERILQQTYPRCQMEWIIVDDSTDGSPDFTPRPGTGLVVRYEHLSEKMVLGAKRNYTARKATGDILVHMDDDDYYPPSRVALAVEALTKNSEVLLAGSTTLPIYFLEDGELWLSGPYHNNHSTAGAWAYRRILLETQHHDPTKAYAEEASFLDNFTLPMQQMNHFQTMICFAHARNTFDKTVLRQSQHLKTNRKIEEDIKQFIPAEVLAQYLALHLAQKVNS